MGALFVAQRARGIDPWSSGIGIDHRHQPADHVHASPASPIGGHVGGLVGGLLTGWMLLDAGPRCSSSRGPPLAIVGAIGAAAFAACLVAAQAAV